MMNPKVLVTAGAGYIGGSVLAQLLSEQPGNLQPTDIGTTVRSTEQAHALSKLGVHVFEVDLNDEAALTNVILRNEIDIVVHTASSAVAGHVRTLIKALGQRRKQGAKEVYFIHSGITALFSEEGGWPSGEIKDCDDVFGKEKQVGPANPVREVDLLVVEESKAQGVTAFDVVIPNVYGKGSGEWRKISTSIPAHVRTGIKYKTVHKFEKDAYAPQVHISDLSTLYCLIVSKILKNEDIPSGEQGYYFAFAHRAAWWTIMHRLASGLHDRGLVSKPEPQVWPSWETAAEYLGWPIQHIRTMGLNSGHQVAVNAYRHLDWQPKWDEKMFLDGLDNEIDTILKFDNFAPSLFKPLMEKKE